MVTEAAELVLFAAKSIIKVSGQVKNALIVNVKKKELVIPLPDFPDDIDWRTARNFFEDAGDGFVLENSRIKVLLDKSQNSNLEDDEKKELMLFYRECASIKRAREGTLWDQSVSPDDFEALVTIVQWERGKNPNSSTLQRIAGTLVEIAVDYFIQNEKILNENSKEHKALRSFLIAIDDVKFAETPMRTLAPELFIVAIESINEFPQLISSGEKGQEIIKGITKNISKNLNTRIQESEGDLVKQETIKSWGILVFKSTLGGAAETILSEPNKFLGIKNDDKAALVSNVGETILDIILGKVIIDDPRFGEIFSRESIDAIIKTSLRTIGEHPDLINIDHDGIRNILVQTAKELASLQDPIGIQLLPEMSRIIIEKTAGNLDSIWPGDHNNPANHLLITASRGLLEAISEPGQGGWKPNLNKEQIIDIAETVIDEVVENPDWILIKLNDKPILQSSLESIFLAIEQIPDNRISKNGIKEIVKLSIKNIALRQDFIDKIPGDTGANKMIITEVLEIIFALTLHEDVDAKIKWVFAKEMIITQLVDTVLNRLAVSGITEQTVESIKDLLTTEIQNLTTGGEFSMDHLILKINQLNL